MRNKCVWERTCGLMRTSWKVSTSNVAPAIVVSVRPVARARVVAVCVIVVDRLRPWRGSSRWRALDLGTTKVFLEADAPRVRWRTHGVTVAAVPWAVMRGPHPRLR